jgi:sec-independent protein translocase protein TatA
MDLGWPEVLLILVIILIVFGAGKLPQVASQLGKGIREFRKGTRGDYDDEGQKEPLKLIKSDSEHTSQESVGKTT